MNSINVLCGIMVYTLASLLNFKYLIKNAINIWSTFDFYLSTFFKIHNSSKYLFLKAYYTLLEN